jgi:uncharacterized protein YceH (UPF0502 family)
MLRGIQTAGELRSRSGRLHEFTSVGEVETALQFLVDKYPPLAARLTKAPGTKESRYAHLLAGEEVLEQQAIADAMSGSAALVKNGGHDRISQLEEEVVGLRRQMEDLSAQFAEFKRQFD